MCFENKTDQQADNIYERAKQHSHKPQHSFRSLLPSPLPPFGFRQTLFDHALPTSSDDLLHPVQTLPDLQVDPTGSRLVIRPEGVHPEQNGVCELDQGLDRGECG